MEKKAILFVDDEMSILRSLKRSFLDSGYQLYFADSGEKALAALSASHIDMVVSDMRMPGMDGYELLKEVKKYHPEVVRLILSGYTEEKTVYKALIDGSAKMYIAKPWDNAKLKSLIAQLLTIEETLCQEKLLEVINTIDELPTLPSVYQEIMSLIEENADFNRIVEVVEKDPAITAKVLQVANSAYFRNKTASLKRAAVYIGLMNLKDIVLGCSVFQVLTGKQAGKLSLENIWEHSLRSNQMVHQFYERVHDEKIDDTKASAGLLHDIGFLVMLRYFPEQFAAIMERHQHQPAVPLISIEQEVMGVNHAQLGAYLLNWWNMPQPIIEATLYHHEPESDAVVDRELVSQLALADAISLAAIDPSLAGEVSPRVMELTGIPEALAAQFLQQYANN
ncbi:MAG: HDOD domain-containing protein [Deltaproteobacteria bacterium]|nr:HDOD domain-containing protein [Candidatus Anaeroferrophillus wilburensis]MBN2889260.1 HDOD domain-containing protein [Deltaproteobacteria bacterium]